MDGNIIEVGDTVMFKSDYEQYGEVVEISFNRVKLHHPHGFGGEYLRYADFTWEDASRVSIEKGVTQ